MLRMGDRMGDERPDEGEGDARERTPRPGSPLLVLGFLAVLGGGFASGLVFLANAHLLGDGLASAEPPAIEVAASLNFTIRDRPARPSTRPCTSTAAAREEINEPCRASRDQILPALLACRLLCFACRGVAPNPLFSLLFGPSSPYSVYSPFRS